MKLEEINHPELKNHINMIYMHSENQNQEAIERTDYVAPGHKLASMRINVEKCVKCGACMEACQKIKAIRKV